jgi:hypothetical protein
MKKIGMIGGYDFLVLDILMKNIEMTVGHYFLVLILLMQ